jgi:acyl dehydratase
MSLDLLGLGKKIGPVTREYDRKDIILYALGVGAGFSDSKYCYEKNLKVIPTFSAAMIFDFFFEAAALSRISLNGILHGEQDIIFFRPIPHKGSLTTEGKITRFYDMGKGKGAMVILETETFHSDGNKLFSAVFTLFARHDGGFGGDAPPKNPLTFPDREPDFEVPDCPSPNQPLLYRLSGDFFPLHADPDFAREAGFEKPVMHGLCTCGFSSRGLILSLIPGKPENVTRIACRFSKPLYPGIPIRTLIWKTGAGKALWKTVNEQTGETVITNGVFEYHTDQQSWGVFS